jgi:hypothetical protein
MAQPASRSLDSQVLYGSLATMAAHACLPPSAVTYLSEIADRSVPATRAIRLRGENTLMGPRVRMEVSNRGPRVTWPWNPTPNVEEHNVRKGAPGSSIAHRRGRPSLHYRSELQRELPPHILHRCLARRESTLQLGIFDCCEHLFEAWTGLISCFDQVAAGN